MQGYVATKTPSQALHAVYDVGKHKVGMTLDILILQSFMAGIYVGLGGQLAITVAGGMTGIAKTDPGLQKFVFGALFPVALYPIVFTGAELFTGDAMVLILSLLGGKISVKQVARNWVVAWVFNFFGCLAWAYVMAYQTALFEHDPWKSYLYKLAEKKMALTFVESFLRGIGANFSVCLSVWLATTAADVPGKVSMMWWPVMTFAAIGFEHCIANMFVISTALMYGADFTIREFLCDSILPSTLGNIAGGSILIGLVYFWLFDHAKALDNIRHSSLNLKHHMNVPHTHPHIPHHDDHHDDHHDGHNDVEAPVHYESRPVATVNSKPANQPL